MAAAQPNGDQKETRIALGKEEFIGGEQYDQLLDDFCHGSMTQPVAQHMNMITLLILTGKSAELKFF